jgi:glutaredoxin-related protein
MEPSFKAKPILNRNELKQIKQSRTRVEGKKVITDDVRKLKSLKVTPDLAPDEAINYYKEPIWIEYYIPKESRFALETKFLYILLIPPHPRPEFDEILITAQKEDTFINLLDLSKAGKDYSNVITKSYLSNLSILETISDNLEQYEESKNFEFLKIPVYLTETLMLTEPTLATLEVLGEYSIHNLIWLIKRLNRGGIPFSLEDRTISLLIKRRNEFFEEKEFPVDDDFELLSALFFEQAYPHRGAEELNAQDFLLD